MYVDNVDVELGGIMSLMKYLLCGATTFLVASPAMANFYVEPSITYQKADNEVKWPSPLNSSTGDSKGFGFGLKLGFHINDVFFAGLDGHYSKPKFTNSATDYDATATETHYGAVIGAQMPVAGLRLWGGYVFGGELDPEKSGAVDVKFKDAKGPKIGVGFKVMMVSLNVEYAELEYDKSVLQEVGPISGSFDSKLTNKMGMISVSMPLTL